MHRYVGPFSAAFWLPFGSRGVPSGSHLALLGGSCGEALNLVVSGVPLGVFLGPLFCAKGRLFLSLNLHYFFNGFLSDLLFLWTLFLSAFCMQKLAWGGKSGFVKMSVSRTRELHFGESGVPESVQKGAQKGSKKGTLFG